MQKQSSANAVYWVRLEWNTIESMPLQRLLSSGGSVAFVAVLCGAVRSFCSRLPVSEFPTFMKS